MNSTAANVPPSVASGYISPDASLGFKIVKITIYVAIFVLTIVGNVLVISVIRHDKRMRGSSHILILNLALCDLITPTISIPFDLAYEEIKYAWPFGSVMCKILWPGQTFTTTSSALILTAICIDRYRALVYPFKVRWAGKFCLMVFSMYIFAVAMVVPYMLVLHLDEGTEKVDCSEKWPSPQKTFKQAYTIVLCLSQYALPLVIMITLYSTTLRSLFNNSKQLLSESSNTKTGSQIPQNREQFRREKSRSIQEIRKKQQVKVTKMFITVVIVFAVSMFPNQVLWLWVDFGNLSNNEYFPIISIICRIFTYSNSVLNPFIYGLYSKDFRSGYKNAGRKISKARKRQQAFYHHFNGTGKGPFQNSIISRGGIVDEEKNLISRNIDSFKGFNQVQSVNKKNEQKENSNKKEGKRRLEQNVLNEKDILSVDSKAKFHMSTTTGKAQTAVLDPEDSTRSPVAVDEQGVKEEDVKSADFFINDNKEKSDLITIIYESIENRGRLKTDLAEYFDELTETQC